MYGMNPCLLYDRNEVYFRKVDDIGFLRGVHRPAP